MAVPGHSLFKRIFPPRFRALIALTRPFTLLAPFIGGISGGLMALGYMGALNWPSLYPEFPFLRWNFPLVTLLYGAAALAMVNAGSNTLNAIYDLEIDRINKPYRPLPTGQVTPDEARTLAWLLYLVALFRATIVNRVFGFFVLLIMLITIVYSVPPLRLKKRLWLSNVSIAFARGLLGFLAAWCMFGSITVPVPWMAGGVMMIFLIGAVTTKDFTDVPGDSAFGMRTLPVVMGKNRAATVTGPFFVLPFIIIAVGLVTGGLKDSVKYLLPFIGWGFYIMVSMRDTASKRDKTFENSRVWAHTYLMLMLLQIGFCAAYIL